MHYFPLLFGRPPGRPTGLKATGLPPPGLATTAPGLPPGLPTTAKGLLGLAEKGKVREIFITSILDSPGTPLGHWVPNRKSKESDKDGLHR